ncbi:CusA/CzcA family heavy metal efflux RND transporter [Saccharobesus litoralis]|uniref:CusA/CzcA family heavy metal efflux RND transporter n=1 Tax=Saccharobesus litoralis TaxID=2172099 RepID=A0A2S0VX47_9ALTE|nr:CusA/CzcA family heavy metal efflux RND transporter [Saccharobesus litoralis]AWB68768.1 CusA/CzcA family heavy metal efflux RND transporter [Saccharobesus litoralis]
MLNLIIDGAIKQRQIVLMLSILLTLAGIVAIQNTKIDAIPDLSDTQVIVHAEFAGLPPEQLDEQVTYPLSRELQSVAKAKTVRAYSYFGEAFLYVIFEQGTDIYWARSRVLEQLSQAQARLPNQVKTRIGPDASGVGWVYQYALIDPSQTQDLAELTRLQDWYLKPNLQAVQGVAEVATAGGMQSQVEIVLDPLAMSAYQVSLSQIKSAVTRHNQSTGGGMLELAEQEVMLVSNQTLTSLEQIRRLPIKANLNKAIQLADVADVRWSPAFRRGVTELNGNGEVVSGIIVMRQGENALTTITAVKQKLAQIKQGLPTGVEIVEVYDRSQLIHQAVDNLKHKLLLEMLLVAAVIIVFLCHLGSSLIAIICIPLSVACAFIVMQQFGVSANLMSLGGIAISIGALVDAAIVMIENAHKHLLQFQRQHQRLAQPHEHWQLIGHACREVGPTLFICLLIMTISFLPVFALDGRAALLFTPLALTKTLSMAAAAVLAITLVPVLMGWWIRGKVLDEQQHKLSLGLSRLYRPILQMSLNSPKVSIVIAILICGSAYWPLSQLQSEFMPEIREGDLMYMPTTQPGISLQKASQLLQQTDRLIKSVPEVKSVLGKVGRAQTVTDPAPVTMLETIIQFKPKSEWRAGFNQQDIINDLDSRLQIPGLTNAWVQPIKTRIDMLSTGVKTPLALQISGFDQAELQTLATQVRTQLAKLDVEQHLFAEQPSSGNYLNIELKPQALREYGMTVSDLHVWINQAIGGQTFEQMFKAEERFAIKLRLAKAYRQTPEAIASLLIDTPSGAQVTLDTLASLNFTQGASLVKSENGLKTATLFISTQHNAQDYIQQATPLLKQVDLPARYFVTWLGDYQQQQAVTQKLLWIVPVVLLLIYMLLYLALQSHKQSWIVLSVLPFALTGSLWFIYWMEFAISLAVIIGMIALAGVAAEFALVMLLYLNQARKNPDTSPLLNSDSSLNSGDSKALIMQGALQRIRPKVMTVATLLLSLYPMFIGQEVGYEVMQRIAAPMLGGMILAPLASLLLVPVLYNLIKPKVL